MSLLSNATSAPNALSPRTEQNGNLGGFFDDPILSAESHITDPRIRTMIEYLRNNLHRNLSLAIMARAVNLSESRLRCLFSEVTGLPLAYYIKLLRLEAARQLLATEYLTVKEVMAKTGIKDSSHFNRDFKSAYGVTPSQYRNLSKCTNNQAFSGMKREDVR